MVQLSNNIASVFNDPNGDAQLPVPSVSGEPVGGSAEKESSPRIDAPDDSTPTPQNVSNGEPSAPMVAGDATEPTDALDDPTSANLGLDSGELPTPAPEGRDLCEKSDAPDDSTLGGSSNSIGTEFDVPRIGKVKLFKGTDGRAYLINEDRGNPLVYLIGSSAGNNAVQSMAISAGVTLTTTKAQELGARLRALAFSTEVAYDVWYRVAPIDGGIILDVGDAARTQLKVTSDGIQTITRGSPVLFRRTPSMKELHKLAEHGDLDLLKKYVNLSDIDRVLFIAWLTYTMAHPKREGTNYVILVIQGDQGSGKTSLCSNVIIPLIDPSSAGVRKFPKNEKAMAIICDHSHVACLDNVRNFNADTSDLLCVTATRSTLSGRALYTDSEQYVDVLHGAIVMNGIHSFVMQPDLAERCLTVYTKSLAGQYKTSAAMQAELQADMPKIFRGLLDCIAGIFRAMPKAQMTVRERMVDFVQWLAAFEASEGIPDVYQQAYSASMQDGQYEMLRGNSFAAAVLDFADELKSPTWTGTPQELHEQLSEFHHINQYRSPDWPANAIALSRRLNGLKASLLSQGIHVQLSRGKERKITIQVETKQLQEASK